MKKIAVVFLLGILTFNWGYSQNIKLEGIVKDTLGNPLEMASWSCNSKERIRTFIQR